MTASSKKSDELTSAERAVNRFQAANEELTTFLHDPEVHGVMLELRRLVENFNATVDAAGRAVKQQLLTSDRDKLVIGPFGAQRKVSRWYDGAYLADNLPHNQAELVLEEIISYKVNVDLLQQLARQGEVDNETIRLAYHEDPPTASMMPGAPKAFTIPIVKEDDEWQEQPLADEPQPQSEERKSAPKTSRGRKK